MRSVGSAVTARLADHDPAWLSWSAPILDASDSSLAVVAKHAGGTDEPDAHSAKTRTITASQFWRSKEKEAFALTIAKACRGYLKTYDGEGSENVLLADWTSIHLDVIARDRGLKRLAASLYTLPVQEK